MKIHIDLFSFTLKMFPLFQNFGSFNFVLPKILGKKSKTLTAGYLSRIRVLFHINKLLVCTTIFVFCYQKFDTRSFYLLFSESLKSKKKKHTGLVRRNLVPSSFLLFAFYNLDEGAK